MYKNLVSRFLWSHSSETARLVFFDFLCIFGKYENRSVIYLFRSFFFKFKLYEFTTDFRKSFTFCKTTQRLSGQLAYFVK